MIVLHVLGGVADQRTVVLPTGGWRPTRDARLDWVHEAVEAPAGLTRKAGVPARAILRFGAPHEEILRAAEREGVDLIVMGASRRGGVRRLLRGSVAARVVRRAPCGVLAVPPGAVRQAAGA